MESEQRGNMRHDKGFGAKNPRPTTVAEQEAFNRIHAAIKAMPPNCHVEFDDFEGRVVMYRRETPGFGRQVAERRIGMKRIRL
jgi:hypothetical protein